MKRIKMEIDQIGSEDGILVKTFDKDKIYVTTDWLADVFVKQKWAIEMFTPEGMGKEKLLTPEGMKKSKKKAKRK